MTVRLRAPQRCVVPLMSNRSGFTLLELLVALALLGIIGTGLASAMRLGTETYSRARTLDTENVLGGMKSSSCYSEPSCILFTHGRS